LREKNREKVVVGVGEEYNKEILYREVALVSSRPMTCPLLAGFGNELRENQ
jgi:hypothetical protein